MSTSKTTEESELTPDRVEPHGELTETHAQAVLMRAEGATYARIAVELNISEDEAREFAPFDAPAGAGKLRDDMRVAIVMGDRQKLADAYAQFRVGLEDVIKVHGECLYANSYLRDNKTGKIYAVPDNRTRMTAVNSYLRAIGVIGEVAQEGEGAKPVELHLHRDTVYKVENLVGKKILPESETRSDRPIEGRTIEAGAQDRPRDGRGVGRSADGAPGDPGERNPNSINGKAEQPASASPDDWPEW